MSEGLNGHGDVLDTSEEHDPHFEPIIQLPLVETSTHEEDEVELIKLRAKLFRFASVERDGPAEWKERGTGDVKLLHHRAKHTVRVVMRRDKTLKICANHFVTPSMDLAPNCGSDRAFVWSTNADFSDETAHSETLAIRFANPENARKWKEIFDEAKNIVATQCELYCKGFDDSGTEEGNEKDDSEESGDEKDIGESLGKLKLGGPNSGDNKSEDKNVADSTTESSSDNKSDDKAVPDSTAENEVVNPEPDSTSGKETSAN